MAKSLAAFRSYLVTPEELHAALRRQPAAALTAPAPASAARPRIVPLCAAYFLPDDPQRRTGAAAFRAQRIPAARFFDLDAVADEHAPLPHMLPGPARFARAMGRLGIAAHDTVVVYDTAALGLFSAPRVAWTLRLFGHARVHVLNNFRLWAAQGLPTEAGEPDPVPETAYGAVPEAAADRYITFDELKTIVTSSSSSSSSPPPQIVDARARARWEGRAPEPRPGLAAGHIPGSLSLPFAELLDPESRALLPPAALRRVFAAHGVDPARPVITTCGSGVTAAVVDLALAEAFPDATASRRVYDGSWAEWGSRLTEDSGLIEKAP